MDAQDELREARDHAKQALTATLKAMRSALDIAIERLDGNDARHEPTAAPEAPRPGDAPPEDDGKMP